MTEREKMLAGLIYTSADRELAALNARAKKTVREYNDCAVEDGEKRKALMRSLLGGCGRNFGMEPPFVSITDATRTWARIFSQTIT